MTDKNSELELIEQGEAWNESDEIVQIEVKKPLDKVVPIRLSAESWEKLRQEARELGIGPTTLARMWVLERLRLQSISQQDLFNFLQLHGPRYFSDYSPISMNPREVEIITLILMDYSVKQIADKLDMSDTKIGYCIKEIMQKLISTQGIPPQIKSKMQT
jgi:hypothetical protein